ncbi:hypothetical protein NQ314_003553 [Rhamnusium bicolor]|uniref:Uncharacterized protein n=1 Tax=Rhamnusium bicolor TaxID=1586634 RepID=A0AAV8ZLS6_9CUCU|nr:hypothetical protein NQ314_003553 [Rhamnusium bicolor]
MFMAILGIHSKIIRTVQEKQGTLTKGILQAEMRGKHNKHASISDDIKNAVRNHINSILRIESHYCRSETKKEYIDGSKTISELYRDYKTSCEKQNIPYSNYLMYYTIFNNEFNIAFFIPKKDQCELCLAFKNASPGEKIELQEKHDTHLKEKELSRKEKEKDKTSNSVVAVYDLQAVLPCPTGDATSLYYVSKLNVFNFTVYQLQNNEVGCYVWHEGQGQRGANEIASRVWHYLVNLNAKAHNEEKIIDVIFYSDNCTGQNKNKFIFALYTFAVSTLENIHSITHRYFITGHTQNEGISAHSTAWCDCDVSERYVDSCLMPHCLQSVIPLLCGVLLWLHEVFLRAGT